MAVQAGRTHVAYGIISSLQQRITAWQHLPAHHQRRRMMDDLGLVKLAHIDASFSSLSSPASDLRFIDDEMDEIPETTVYSRLVRRRTSDFYEHTRLTSTEFLILYQELRRFIRMPRDGDIPLSPGAAPCGTSHYRLSTSLLLSFLLPRQVSLPTSEVHSNVSVSLSDSGWVERRMARRSAAASSACRCSSSCSWASRCG
jgi:hypothetical protein